MNSNHAWLTKLTIDDIPFLVTQLHDIDILIYYMHKYVGYINLLSEFELLYDIEFLLKWNIKLLLKFDFVLKLD